MIELLAPYWWVLLITVPAVAVAFRFIAERSNLVPALSAPLQSKIAAFDYSYPGNWVVTVSLRDGRRFSRVVISEKFRLVSETSLPFRAGDIADIAWEGAGVTPEGPPVRLSPERVGIA